MADLVTKEITLVDKATSANANALFYIDNNGTFQRANFDDVFKITNTFSILRGDGIAHNGIFRGKDLTKVYTIAQIYSMVTSGKFDDLFLGDYFTVSITTTLPDETVKTESISLMIAGFDYYYNCGDTALTKHHIVLIPRTRFATTAKMNSTNTTAGGYLNSYMHQTVLPCYAESLQTALSNHVLTYRDWLTNEVNTTTPSMAGSGLNGATTNGEWTDVTLQLMNEVQVYGTMAASSSYRDVMVANRQLPVFKYIGPQHYGRGNFWLRSVVSSTYFAYCAGDGLASLSSASHAYCVRPLILFG